MVWTSAQIYRQYKGDSGGNLVIGAVGDEGKDVEQPKGVVEGVSETLGEVGRFYLSKEYYIRVEGDKVVVKKGEEIIEAKNYKEVVLAMNKERKVEKEYSGWRIKMGKKYAVCMDEWSAEIIERNKNEEEEEESSSEDEEGKEDMGRTSAEIYDAFKEEGEEIAVIGAIGDDSRDKRVKHAARLVQEVVEEMGDSGRFYVTKEVYLTVEKGMFELKRGEDIVRPKDYTDVVFCMNIELGKETSGWGKRIGRKYNNWVFVGYYSARVFEVKEEDSGSERGSDGE